MALTAFLLAAATTAPASCVASFDAVASATREQYAGYVIKLPDDASQAAHRRFHALMRQRAVSASNHDECREVLQAYVGFFGDHHLFIASRDNGHSPIPVDARRWTAARSKKYFDREAAALDPVEGFWFDAAGPIAVVRDAALGPGRFIAARADGEPLALLTRHGGGYRIAVRHESWGWQALGADLRRAGDLLVFGTQAWGRPDAEHVDPKDPQAPVFAEIDEGIYLLSMPSFMPQYREPLMKIIELHGQQMAQARGLVVDVRGNGGGDAIYFPLAPYFLANEIEVSSATNVRASRWTLAYFEQFRQRLGDQGAFLDDALARMRANPGAVVPYLEASRDGIPEYPAKPEQVLVLQDRGVGSAAEAFIFHARQSEKVLTLGEPTRGNIDYMQVSMHAMGEGDYRYWFGYPLYFARDLPAGSVDDEGYAPDVRLTIPETQWPAFAREWFAGSASGVETPP